MALSTSFWRRIIVGDSYFVLSHAEFKRILLTGQLSLLTAVACLGYLAYDLSNQVFVAWPFQLICAALASASFFVNRSRRHLEAKVMLGVATNATIFVFASSEPSQTGLHSLYIPVALGAMAGFGYEERKWGLAFTFISIALCLISLFADLHLLPSSTLDPKYVQLNLAANIMIATIASVLILYFLISVNYRAEKSILENELELRNKNEELTKLNTELDRFVYSSSHDLRAPLTSVLGLIQLTELSDEPSEIKGYTRMMKSRIEELDKFIRDISDYSRNVRQQSRIEQVNIKRLIRDILESLRYYPGAEHVQIEMSIKDDHTIITDATRFRMVMANLLSNSFKYSDPGKNERFVKVRAENTDGNILVEVEDNGIGIPSDRVDKVFDMFFQAHDHSVGSGLGLYIVKETMTKLGGQISVQSEVGKGSRFQIQLPLN